MESLSAEQRVAHYRALAAEAMSLAGKAATSEHKAVWESIAANLVAQADQVAKEVFQHDQVSREVMMTAMDAA